MAQENAVLQLMPFKPGGHLPYLSFVLSQKYYVVKMPNNIAGSLFVDR